MMKNLLSIVLFCSLAFCFSSCDNTPPPLNKGVQSGANTSQPKRTKYKIVVFGDKSGSILGKGIPQLKASDLKPLLKEIQLSGGQLSVGLIGHRSKRELITFRPNSKLEYPKQKPGESAKDFMERVAKYEQKEKDSQNSVDDTPEKIMIFEKELQEFLDYSNLESSDVAGAVEIGNLILSEVDDELDDAKKFLLFITDGENYSNSGSKFPSKLSGKMIVVNTSKSAADLDRYNPIVQTTIEGAIRIILSD